jgi:hypothetical protein
MRQTPSALRQRTWHFYTFSNSIANNKIISIFGWSAQGAGRFNMRFYRLYRGSRSLSVLDTDPALAESKAALKTKREGENDKQTGPRDSRRFPWKTIDNRSALIAR